MIPVFAVVIFILFYLYVIVKWLENNSILWFTLWALSTFGVLGSFMYSVIV